jgi:hypothetical protein
LLYINNEHTEKEIRKTILFTTVSKKIPRNKFNEGNQRHFNENYKSLKTEIKKTSEDGKISPVCGSAESIL